MATRNIHLCRSSRSAALLPMNPAQCSILSSDLSEMTAIKKEDVLAALQNLNIIRYQQGSYVLSITKDLFDSYQDKRRLRVNTKNLFWTPKLPTKPANQFQNKWLRFSIDHHETNGKRFVLVNLHIVQNISVLIVVFEPGWVLLAGVSLFDLFLGWFTCDIEWDLFRSSLNRRDTRMLPFLSLYPKSVI